MEIRNLYDAVMKIKALERKQTGDGELPENEGLQLAELKSYVEFMLTHQLSVPNNVQVKKIPTRIGSEYQVKVRYPDLSQFYEGFMITKARGGIYIKTNNLLLVGTMLDLYISIESAKLRFHFPGKVVWSAPKTMGNIPPGMGIKFSDLKARERQILDSFIEGTTDVSALKNLSSRKVD